MSSHTSMLMSAEWRSLLHTSLYLRRGCPVERVPIQAGHRGDLWEFGLFPCDAHGRSIVGGAGCQAPASAKDLAVADPVFQVMPKIFSCESARFAGIRSRSVCATANLFPRVSFLPAHESTPRGRQWSAELPRKVYSLSSDSLLRLLGCFGRRLIERASNRVKFLYKCYNSFYAFIHEFKKKPRSVLTYHKSVCFFSKMASLHSRHRLINGHISLCMFPSRARPRTFAL